MSTLLIEIGIACPRAMLMHPTTHLCIYQALRLVKADLEETKRAKAALEAEGETKEATIATLQSKVRPYIYIRVCRFMHDPARVPT